MTVLDEDAVRAALAADLPTWELREGRLQRELTFADFAEAFAFLTRVALVAQRRNHHPDLWCSWNRVRLSIVSHAEGGVTDQCVALATAIDALQ